MATATDTKPEKPYQEFPLFAHQNGTVVQRRSKENSGSLVSGLNQTPHWRSISMKSMSFKRAEIPGKRVSSTELLVADMCSLFHERQQQWADAGKITIRHFIDCLTVMQETGGTLRQIHPRNSDASR